MPLRLDREDPETAQSPAPPQNPRQPHQRSRSFPAGAQFGFQVIPQVLLLVGRQFFKLFTSRSIVMSAAINHCIGNLVLRQKWVACIPVESILKNRGSRYLECVSKLRDIGRNDSQVFGDEW